MTLQVEAPVEEAHETDALPPETIATRAPCACAVSW